MKGNGKDKFLLKVGLVVFALLMGIDSLLLYCGIDAPILYYMFLCALFAFCTISVARFHYAHLRIARILAILVCSLLSGLLIFFTPWAGIADLSKDALNVIGYFVVQTLYLSVSALASSVVLTLTIIISTGILPRKTPIFIIRLLFVIFAVALATALSNNIFLYTLQITTPPFVAIVGITDRVVGQLLFSFTYYFIAVSFMGDMRFIGRAKQSQ